MRRLVARTDSTGAWQYLYGNTKNPFQLTAMRDPAGVLSYYYYDDSGKLFAFDKGGTRYYVATDQLGTPKVITDATGTVVKQMEFDSFGMWTADSKPEFEMPVGFAGGIVDTRTTLVRFGYRDYEPGNGRWTAKDPIFFAGGLNLFNYVRNNPINFFDPWGLLRYTGTAGDPVNATTTSAMECFERCAGHEVTITAGQEGGHSRGSAHETGQACDVGTNSNPWLDRETSEGCFNQCFSQDSSFGQQEGNHYHFQTRPGRGGATGFAPGIR